MATVGVDLPDPDKAGPAEVTALIEQGIMNDVPLLRLRGESTGLSTLSDVVTPAALIDEARMMRNISRMQDRINALGVRLRPHVKTSKCIEVARRQSEQGARGSRSPR